MQTLAGAGADTTRWSESSAQNISIVRGILDMVNGDSAANARTINTHLCHQIDVHIHLPYTFSGTQKLKCKQ